MFDIIVLDGNTKLPGKGNYFVVAKEGVFLHKETTLVEATVKVDGISFLKSINAYANLNLPMLPAYIFVQALSFFRWVQGKFGSEAIVLVHYSAELNKFLLHCPIQGVNGGRVVYSAADRFDDFQLVASIHSHNNFRAFHSPIDEKDEKNFDGMHITIGHVNREFFTLTSSIVVNNNRFEVKPETVIEGIKFKFKTKFRKKKKVIVSPKAISDEEDMFEEDDMSEEDENKFLEFFCGRPGFGNFVADPEPEIFYDILLNGKSCQDKWGFPGKWKSRVTRIKDKEPEKKKVNIVKPLHTKHNEKKKGFRKLVISGR